MVPGSKLVSGGQVLPPADLPALGISLCSEPSLKVPRKCSVSLSPEPGPTDKCLYLWGRLGKPGGKRHGTHLEDCRVIPPRAPVPPSVQGLGGPAGLGLIARKEIVTPHCNCIWLLSLEHCPKLPFLCRLDQ